MFIAADHEINSKGGAKSGEADKVNKWWIFCDWTLKNNRL
jgi:hypothetical protein